MHSRRDFLKTTALSSGIALLTPSEIINMLDKKKHKLGIQFFSVPKGLGSDLTGTLSMLQQQGYKEVELFGPYPFSPDVSKKSWAMAEKSLGFKGSGFFGKTAQEFATILKNVGLNATGAHSDIDTLEKNMAQLGEAANVLGFTYVTLPAVPEDRRKTVDDYHRVAESFNKIGESAKKYGLRFGYHNHGYGIVPTKEGIVPLEMIINETDPNLVFLEMDIFWTTCGGADPVALLNKYPNRYKMLHIKDMSEKARFAGNGDSMMDWFPMFPKMASCGDGVLDLKNIISTAIKNGVEHYYVEQDMVANPQVALKRSADFLKRRVK